MTIADVGAWLGTIKLPQHAAVFAQNYVDGNVLRKLNDEALAEVGIKGMEQKRILGGIATLEQSGFIGLVVVCSLVLNLL